ncbi:unnamed protein product [Rotaria sp. Silwood2]|nr:unnamed protein product [Rotaria sp. Silwood2]CAF3243293.1 unnamed protein product [Rotaria sp. Silwood2]CAF3537819.1 unnamed protein product [Rotaria sp. Silwood2]CAF4631647.1 unnamed protein product [Rotaria sp. Silwood2]CAF4633983.1 unnamed protein product [Rotaria sp. Silwood2]
METVDILSERDKWILLDAPRCSEEELQEETARYGLENDPQTARFCKFVAVATNFASLRFAERIQLVPELIDSIRQLLEEIQREMQEMAGMGTSLEELVHRLNSLVLTTQHNMKMMLPDLKNAKDYLDITVEALQSNADEPLNDQDRSDIEIALDGMCFGIQNLLQLSQKSGEQSEKLDQDIKNLQQTVQNKRVVVEGRIDFGEHFKIVSQAIAAVGTYTASNALTANGMQHLGRIPGLIRVGSLIYPPLRPILISVVLGGITASTISMLVKRFWLKHNYRALEILENLFDHLIRLNEANDRFGMYMRNSQTSANDVLVNIKTVQRQITSSSPRIRKMNQAVCQRASKATFSMIDSIEKVLAIDMADWTSFSAQRIATNENKSPSNQRTLALTYEFD